MNNFSITQDFLPAIPKEPYENGVGAWEGVVAHATDAMNDTALSERNYEASHWQDAFVHFFVDYETILNVADINYKAWGAGYPANMKFVHVELCETKDPVKFKESYDRWTWTLAHILFSRKLGVIDGKTLLSHAEVSRIFGDTDHTDPCGADGKSGYLGTHGITWTNVVEDVKRIYAEMESSEKHIEPPKPVEKPKPVVEQPKPQPSPVAKKTQPSEESMPTLSLNAKGKDVEELQALLNKELGSHLVTDGDFGQKTQQAVISFQRAKGLNVDGIVGRNTWEALGK